MPLILAPLPPLTRPARIFYGGVAAKGNRVEPYQVLKCSVWIRSWWPRKRSMLYWRCGHRRGPTHHSVECRMSSLRHRPFSVPSLLLLHWRRRLLFDTVASVCIASSRKRWLDYLPGVVVGEPEFDEAVEVVQDLRIAKDGCPPVCVDATLELRVCLCNLCLQRRNVHGMDWRVA